ncbi:GNAT family N-acetyltransferase [Siccirubricoccus sp. KC 17139]|uniref:GNAT family N-acetyltransferase n=1 Tax=Siccirubricoccus soli TaxID=2899147 RepID=A0ABT1D3J1_9PROT|nr:GNAT family N-acetyltransferase [Siccirubricoccus soli]MCO6416449.1 GNAT family N-acetyltransferase [Siccirubricoccus soli]MCP2682583.1 GNAT family N-acetyltransferase [Siccirubricoccus soli]
MAGTALGWRPMQAADLPAVCALADALHPEHPEPPEVFAERLELAPEGCRVLAGEGALVGYAIGHGWSGTAPPPLGARLGALPARPGAFHLHDVALLPAARGGGHATAVLAALSAGWLLVTLVAVADAVPYWLRQGFRDRPCADPAALASYGEGARFMARRSVTG